MTGIFSPGLGRKEDALCCELAASLKFLVLLPRAENAVLKVGIAREEQKVQRPNAANSTLEEEGKEREEPLSLLSVFSTAASPPLWVWTLIL